MPKDKWNKVSIHHKLVDDLTKDQLEVFKSDAIFIKDCPYWKWFMEDMELLAERKMFKGDPEALIFGKGILFCLEMMTKNMNEMAKGNVKIDSKFKKAMRRFLK